MEQHVYNTIDNKIDTGQLKLKLNNALKFRRINKLQIFESEKNILCHIGVLLKQTSTLPNMNSESMPYYFLVLQCDYNLLIIYRDLEEDRKYFYCWRHKPHDIHYNKTNWINSLFLIIGNRYNCSLNVHFGHMERRDKNYYYIKLFERIFQSELFVSKASERNEKYKDLNG